jgi:hypothetical protein
LRERDHLEDPGLDRRIILTHSLPQSTLVDLIIHV